MTTTVVSHAAPPRTTAARDRTFYTGMSILMASVVMIGFAPTYYLRGYFGAPKTISGTAALTPMMHVHATLFTSWVLLFIVQTALVAGRRVALHRKLGVAGAVLAAAMVIVGVNTTIEAARRGAAPGGVDPLAFMVVPLFDVTLFAGFVTAAVLRRREKEAHKRLMLLAYVSIITAAVARLPGLVVYGPLVFFGLSLLFVVMGMVYDRISRGRIHRVYLWGGALLFVSVPLRLALSGTAAWRAFAEFLVR
jgi:hypothetical protein